jgi:hypothetical protein
MRNRSSWGRISRCREMNGICSRRFARWIKLLEELLDIVGIMGLFICAIKGIRKMNWKNKYQAGSRGKTEINLIWRFGMILVRPLEIPATSSRCTLNYLLTCSKFFPWGKLKVHWKIMKWQHSCSSSCLSS